MYLFQKHLYVERPKNLIRTDNCLLSLAVLFCFSIFFELLTNFNNTVIKIWRGLSLQQSAGWSTKYIEKY
jgi:hypothetical protein